MHQVPGLEAERDQQAGGQMVTWAQCKVVQSGLHTLDVPFMLTEEAPRQSGAGGQPGLWKEPPWS